MSSKQQASGGAVIACVARWGAWLAAACDGTLTSPSRLPEEDIEKNYRGAR